MRRFTVAWSAVAGFIQQGAQKDCQGDQRHVGCCVCWMWGVLKLPHL